MLERNTFQSTSVKQHKIDFEEKNTGLQIQVKKNKQLSKEKKAFNSTIHHSYYNQGQKQELQFHTKIINKPVGSFNFICICYFKTKLATHSYQSSSQNTFCTHSSSLTSMPRRHSRVQDTQFLLLHCLFTSLALFYTRLQEFPDHTVSTYSFDSYGVDIKIYKKVQETFLKD